MGVPRFRSNIMDHRLLEQLRTVPFTSIRYGLNLLMLLEKSIFATPRLQHVVKCHTSTSAIILQNPFNIELNSTQNPLDTMPILSHRLKILHFGISYDMLKKWNEVHVDCLKDIPKYPISEFDIPVRDQLSNINITDTQEEYKIQIGANPLMTTFQLLNGTKHNNKLSVITLTMSTPAIHHKNKKSTIQSWWTDCQTRGFYPHTYTNAVWYLMSYLEECVKFEFNRDRFSDIYQNGFDTFEQFCMKP